MKKTTPIILVFAFAALLLSTWHTPAPSSGSSGGGGASSAEIRNATNDLPRLVATNNLTVTRSGTNIFVGAETNVLTTAMYVGSTTYTSIITGYLTWTNNGITFTVPCSTNNTHL